MVNRNDVAKMKVELQRKKVELQISEYEIRKMDKLVEIEDLDRKIQELKDSMDAIGTEEE